MDYMRQTKIQKLQDKIDKIKAEDTYKSALEFIYNHVKWFYDINYEELKREIISADMIYNETDAAYSHNEVNYEANIILEVKQYYVLIYYEYDYSNDRYPTRIQIIRKTEKAKPDLIALTESFIEDDGADYMDRCNNANITHYYIGNRLDFNYKTANKLITKYNTKLRYVEDSFVKMLAIGLSFHRYYGKIDKTQLQLLNQILCSAGEQGEDD